MDMEEAIQAVDVPVTVCLEHGSFVPCRKNKSSEHRYSTDPRDVELVRYHQQVSVRLQPKPPPPPVYVEVTGIDPEDWSFSIDEEYGSPVLRCDGRVLSISGSRYLTGCQGTFLSDTARSLIADIQHHIATVKHYREQRPGASPA